MSKNQLTEHQEQFIKDYYLKMGKKTMSREIGCSVKLITDFMEKNNLVVSDELKLSFRYINRPVKSSISQHDDFLRENYLKIPVKTMARMIGKSNSEITVFTRLRQLGLVIPKELAEKRKRESCFPKGHVPANKGKKVSEYMTADQIEKLKQTSFKKGNIPHNTAPEGDGAIRIRHDHENRGSNKTYKWIRLSLGKWELLHKQIWEQVNGPVPEGYCLWFKNQDSMDCRLDNLELITREENMKRNSVHNLPEDLKELVYIKGRLVKEINKQIKNQNHDTRNV